MGWPLYIARYKLGFNSENGRGRSSSFVVHEREGGKGVDRRIPAEGFSVWCPERNREIDRKRERKKKKKKEYLRGREREREKSHQQQPL